MRTQQIRSALEQYEEGAITFVEFVRFAMGQVTSQDVHDHNANIPRPADGGSAMGDAEWPFEG